MDIGFSRFCKLYHICLEEKKQEAGEQRWTGAWVTWILGKMFAGSREEWDKYAKDLGVYSDTEKAQQYRRSERKRDLEHSKNLANIFAAHTWGDVENGQA